MLQRKKFTLVELIVVVAVLALLVAIVIPNVSSIRTKSIATSIQSNIRNYQTSVDMYALDHNGLYPTNRQPSVDDPQEIDLEKLNSEYVQNKPLNKNIPTQKYWVDSYGTVWGSTEDTPSNLFVNDKYLEWDTNQDIKGYNVYKPKNGEMTSASYNGIQSLTKIKEIEVAGDVDKIQIPFDQSVLISAVDQYGLETAPVGIYRKSSDLKPVINREGTYSFEINSDELLYWDAFDYQDYRPPGSTVSYSFSVSDEKENNENFVSDFKSLKPAKNIKVKVEIKGANGKMPSVYYATVHYHYAKDAALYQRPALNHIENLNASNQISDPTQPTTLQYEMKLEPGKSIRDLVFTDSYVQQTLSYAYSADKSYSQVTSDKNEIPSGSYVRIQRIIQPTNEPAIHSEVQPPIIRVSEKPVQIQKTTVESVQQEWSEVNSLTFLAQAAEGETNHWISLDKSENTPLNTRIVYSFSTKNNGSWSTPVNDLSKVSDSRYLRITASLQVKTSNLKETEPPSLNSFRVITSRGSVDLNTVKPEVVIVPEKNNNYANPVFSTTTKINWNYESFDPKGKKIVEVLWSGDKREQYSTPGTYTVKLKVRNESNYWSDEKSFTFEVKEEKPVAMITYSSSGALNTTSTITWSSSNSYDPDSDGIVDEEWAGDKRSNYTQEGTYNVQLRVKDSEGNWSDWVSKELVITDKYGVFNYDLNRGENGFSAPYGTWGSCTATTRNADGGIYLTVPSGCSRDIKHAKPYYYDPNRNFYAKFVSRIDVDYNGLTDIGFIHLEDGRHSTTVRGRVMINGVAVYTNSTNVKAIKTWEFFVNTDKSYAIKINGVLVKSGVLTSLPTEGYKNITMGGNLTSGTHFLGSLQIQN